MSLVSGPGRGMASLPAEARLHVDKHVKYIQSLDTVRLPGAHRVLHSHGSDRSSAKTSWSTGSPSTLD